MFQCIAAARRLPELWEAGFEAVDDDVDIAMRSERTIKAFRPAAQSSHSALRTYIFILGGCAIAPHSRRRLIHTYVALGSSPPPSTLVLGMLTLSRTTTHTDVPDGIMNGRKSAQTIAIWTSKLSIERLAASIDPQRLRHCAGI